MMHTMERYFIPGIKCELTDEIAEGLLRTVVKNARIVKENRSDYDANAEIMWAGALSHNDLTECGRGKDFSVHTLNLLFCSSASRYTMFIYLTPLTEE